MAEDQYGVSSVVVAFLARPRHAGYLTPLDRMDVCSWRDLACRAGYDRMVIHEREEADDGEIGDFLCLYRRNEAWSRWGFARKGSLVSVWSCLNGADLGEFLSMSAALHSVLECGDKPEPAEPRNSVIATLIPRIRQVTSFGSAA